MEQPDCGKCGHPEDFHHPGATDGLPVCATITSTGQGWSPHCGCDGYEPMQGEGDVRHRDEADAGPGRSPGRPEPDSTVALRPAYGTMGSLGLHMDELVACGRRLWLSCGWSDEALDRLWADVKAAGR
jgi:hypothetical protein